MISDYSQLVNLYKELKQERDELAAQVEVMRDALNEADLMMLCCDFTPDGFVRTRIRESLSITGPAALREIQARTLEEAATNWVYGAGSASDMLREMAAAKRKGE